jgi:hypothetical protein
MGCDLRLSTRDGYEISDAGGALSSAVRKANLSGQRRTLDWNEHHAVGTKAAHRLRHKRDTEARREGKVDGTCAQASQQ